MRIARVVASGIHRRLRVEAPIEAVTIVCGPNGSGKSTVLGLPGLVLEGPAGPNYPLLGASPTYDWAASVTFEDVRPLTVTRWMKDGEHRLAVNREKGKLRDVEMQIAARIGASMPWKVDALLAMTPAKRQDWLVSQAILSGDLESPAQVRAFWAMLDEAGIAQDLSEVLRINSARPSVSAVLADLRALVADANAEALELKSTEDGSESVDLPPGTVASWRARVAALDARAGELREERGRRAGHGLARADLATAEQEVVAEMEKLAAVDHAAVRQRAEAALAEATLRLESATAAETEARRVYDEQVEAERAAHTALREAERRTLLAQSESTVMQAIDPARLGVDGNLVLFVERATGHAVTAAVYRRDGLAFTTGHGALGIDALFNEVDFLTRWAAYPLELAPEIMPRLVRAIAGGTAPVLSQERAEQELAEALQGVTSATMRHQAADRTERRAREAASTALAVRERANTAVGQARESIAAAVRAHAAAVERGQRLHQRLEEIRGQLGALLDGAEDEIQAQLDEIASERAEAQRNADRLSDEAARSAARLEREARRAAEVKRRTRGRELLKQVERMQGKLLMAATAPLEGPASEITRHVLGADLRVSLDKGASFALAFPGHVAPIRASRSEAAVAMVALRCAVMNRLGGYRFVALDDMENLEGARRALLIEAMVAEVQAGRLDTFLGAYVMDGWVPGRSDIGFLDTRDSTVIRRDGP